MDFKMLFTSPFFLFAFLPLFLAIYFAIPMRLKNLFLLLAGLFFYFTTSGELTVILVLSVLVNYAVAHQIARNQTRAARLWLFAGVALNVAPLIYYKYSVFFLAALQRVFATLGVTLTLPNLAPPLPIGISFFTFQAVSYIADVAMGRVRPARSVVDFGMYHTCFPQLIAGPIVRYEEVEPEVHVRAHTIDQFYHGMTQFCFGLAKKVILADPIGVIADAAFALPQAELTTASAWLGILSYTLQIFFDFSGYSDMAIGLGRMLGFAFPQNFDQPYRSLSITEFWRRWHMTLSRWFRDYVYIPLGGNRTGQVRTLFNLGLVFFLCGLWHGASATFVVWGIYHGVLLILERLIRPLLAFRVPAWLAWVYATTAVILGWVFFRADTISDAIFFIGRMFSLPPHSLAPALGSIVTNEKLAIIAVAAVVSLLPLRPTRRVGRNAALFHPAVTTAALVCACLAIVMLSTNSFTPFIYFRF